MLTDGSLQQQTTAVQDSAEGFGRHPQERTRTAYGNREWFHQNATSARRGESRIFTWWGRSSSPPGAGWGPDPEEPTEFGGSPVSQSSGGSAAPPDDFSTRPKPRCGRSCPLHWRDTSKWQLSDKLFDWKIATKNRSENFFRLQSMFYKKIFCIVNLKEQTKKELE